MNEELLKHAKAIRFELISLEARLEEPFASNVRTCIESAQKIVNHFEGYCCVDECMTTQWIVLLIS